MALTERQKIARKGKMTGSRIGVVAGGSDRDLYDLWLELTGDPSFEPPDYSNVWPVQLGNATEQFHLDWIAKDLGQITARGDSFQHEDIPWAAVTLDGWLKERHCAVEAKHTGGFENAETVLARYMPQLHWTMYCTKTKEICFSVIMGAKEPKPVFIECNESYMAALAEQADAFMRCVFNLTEPAPNPYLKPPKPEFKGIVDMSGSNLWASAAKDWLDNYEDHRVFEWANKELKTLVPADAKEAFGSGIRATRNKAGSLSIKREQDNGTGEGTS